MKPAKNKCKWLNIGKTTTCGKICVVDYCGQHLKILKEKTKLEPQPCLKCGVGTNSKAGLCFSKECGGHRASQKYIDIEKTARRRFKKVLKEFTSIYSNHKEKEFTSIYSNHDEKKLTNII